MKKVEIELYSDVGSSAIVLVPERRFPGIVVQGDTLSTLHANSKSLSTRLKELGVQDDELLYAAQELQEQLLGRLLHYQQTLAAYGIELPYTCSATPSDLVCLIAEPPR